MLALMESPLEVEMTNREWSRAAVYGLGTLLTFLALCIVVGTDRVLSVLVDVISFLAFSILYPLSILAI
jgi:hypothetical protein